MMKKREISTSKSCGISRFVFFAILLAATVFASCASKPKIAEFTLQSGVQQYFVHQITIKKSKFLAQFDATIHVDNSKLIDNPVVRYMLYDQIFGQEPHEVLMSFESGGKEYVGSKPKLLYKDAELNGQRFEMEMAPEDFTHLVYSEAPVFLVFRTVKNGMALGKVESKDFRESLDKLRYIIRSDEETKVDMANVKDLMQAIASVESNE